jgi:hypothetical protein
MTVIMLISYLESHQSTHYPKTPKPLIKPEIEYKFEYS